MKITDLLRRPEPPAPAPSSIPSRVPYPEIGDVQAWLQHPESILYWLDTSFGTGGILVVNRAVVATAPIFARNLLLRDLHDVGPLLGSRLRSMERVGALREGVSSDKFRL